jgi:glycosyltransferase involved in cell wall biosynthesis
MPNLSRYDLVWCFELPSALAMIPILRSRRIPVVVDAEAVHHVVNEKGTLDEAPLFAGRDLRRVVHEIYRRRDASASRYWIEHLAAEVETIAFTSPIEAKLFDLPNAAVLPNGYETVPFRGARAVSPRQTLLFVGWMHYAPNADAAQFLTNQIVPELRSVIGHDFEVRLVGSAPESVRALGNHPNIVVTGYVEELMDELERADVVVVPLRAGAGTRVKILEAFANQVPVVSTTFGAMGLDVEDGRHLLLADDPRSFAQACRDLLIDGDLRSRLVANAHGLVRGAHDWSAIQAQIADLALRAMPASVGSPNSS